MKTCFYCKETINKEALKCRYCQSDLTMSHKDKIVHNTNIVLRRLIVLPVCIITSVLTLLTIYKIFEPTIWYAMHKDEIERVKIQNAEAQAEREAAKYREDNFEFSDY
jgi:hypothetical protein